MWKLAVGFAIFAALAIYMLMQGGDIDLGGEAYKKDLEGYRVMVELAGKA